MPMIALDPSQFDSGHALLSVAEMARADALAVASGIPGLRLMEAAGVAVANELHRRWPRGPVVVLCGPGNNGGDGFIAAQRLGQLGRAVRVARVGGDKSTGDAAQAAACWQGPVLSADADVLDGAAVVVDALFGAGLQRPIDGAALAMIDQINRRRLPCLAVDLPSGVHGDTGQVLGGAPQCTATVTFFRKKPGHLLLPGRQLCGDTTVADIGIPAAVMATIAPRMFENDPALWRHLFPWPRPADHKYCRGHLLVVGGAVTTGAARLAARAARRIGAGLVTIACPADAHPTYALDAPGHLTAIVDDDAAFGRLLEDRRCNAVVIGPGLGLGKSTRIRTMAALTAGKACLVDADALTAFASEPESLWRHLGQSCLMTPHEGEFARLFPDLTDGASKISRARRAASRAGAPILVKGADTVIADSSDSVIVNGNAPSSLATAGSGDVLAGIAGGLLAQGLGGFGAGAMAAWLHGEAARRFGPGLIAEDLVDGLPPVLRDLWALAGLGK